MKPGYSRATVQANIADLMREEGYPSKQAAMMALSEARRYYFKKHPHGLLPSYLAWQGRRHKGDYLVTGVPIGLHGINPVKALSIGAGERARIQADIDNMFSGKGEALRRAAALYGGFTGHDDPRISKVRVSGLPGKPRAALVIGDLDFLGLAENPDRAFTWEGRARPQLCASPDGKQLYIIGGTIDLPKSKNLGKVHFVGYSTIRDHEAEKYIHRFKAASRPLLFSSIDGKQLTMRGGAYDFTDRGIVDKTR